MSHVNNFVIGLGGTGGLSVAAFRRAVSLRRKEMQTLKTNHQVQFEYLYIDSNAADLNTAIGKNDTWTVANESVALAPNQIIDISAGNVSLRDLGSIENIRHWIGNQEDLKNGIQDPSIVGAGQRRRYGRVLFALNAANVYNTIHSAIQRMVQNNTTLQTHGLTFHIFATLGGGTGSGSIVDMVTLIHHICATNGWDAHLSINLYLYVGGPGAAGAAGYFHGNEYAALRDINALMAGRYHPYLAGVPVPPLDPYYHRSNVVMGVYLSSDMAELSVPLSAQVDNMANSCLDMVSFVLCGIIPASVMMRHVTGEDLLAIMPGELRRERDGIMVNDSADVSKGELPERSYYFKSVSSKHLRHPADEIASVLKSQFALQVYGRWLKGHTGNRSIPKTYQANREIFDWAEVALGCQPYKEMLESYAKQMLEPFTRKAHTKATHGAQYSEDLLSDLTASVKATVAKISDEMAEHTANSEAGRVDPACSTAQAAAEYVHAQLCQLMNQLRAWGTKKNAWGIEQLKHFVDTLQTDLRDFQMQDVACPRSCGNMEDREQQWKKAGVIPTLFGMRLNQMLENHYRESYAVVNRALEWYCTEMNRIMVKSLLPLVNSVSQHLSQLIASLLKTQELEGKHLVDTLAKLEAANDHVSLYVYDSNLLTVHRNHIKNVTEAEIGPFMNVLDKKWHDAFAQGIVPYKSTEFATLIGTIETKGADGAAPEDLWTISRHIHNTYAQANPNTASPVLLDSIYLALASYTKNAAEMGVQLVQNSLPVQLTITAGPGLTVDTRVSPRIGKAYGTSPAVTVEDPAQNEMSNQAATELSRAVERTIQGGMSLEIYPQEDPYEARLLYLLTWMPARFLTITKHLSDIAWNHYSGRIRGAAASYSYFTSLDPEGEGFHSEDRPSLIPLDYYGPIK